MTDDERSPLDMLMDVADYLHDHPEIRRETGLTPEKVYDRGRIIRDPERPDWIVFKVERHRAILDTVYQPGLPMSAFVTYWMRYAYHPGQQNFAVLEEEPANELTVEPYFLAEDWLYDFSFRFDTQQDGMILCQEMCTNAEELVSDWTDVKKFAMQIAGTFVDPFLEKELTEYASKRKADEIMTEILEACTEILCEKAMKDWERFQKEREG